MKSSLLALILILATAASAQPWQPQILWQREGAQDSSRYGAQLLALGDQNDDGYADFGVVGFGRDGSLTDLPVLEFFHGGNPPESTPYFSLSNDSIGPFTGARTIGDVNGDGFTDWWCAYRLCGDIDNCLQARIYFGGPNASEQPAFVRTIGGFSGYIPVGDFNGDGFDDVLFVDSWEGYSWINFGGSPFDTIPDWNRSVVLIPRYESHGDINGDGYADFISDASGNFFDFYLGGASPDTNLAFRWTTVHGHVPLVQDVNADGYDDMLFTRTARTDVYFGGPTVIDTTADAHLNFACGQNTGPYRATSIGDINGDGCADVAEWTYWCPDSWFGTLALHLGGATIPPQPVWVYNGWTGPYNVIGIEDVKGLGDVNGDGTSDFAVGGYDDTPYLGWRGKAVVLGGIPLSAEDPRVPVPRDLSVSAYPNPFNNTTTIQFRVPRGQNRGGLRIYNVLGETVARRELRVDSPEFTVSFEGMNDNGNSLPSGIYILTAQFGDLASSLKLVLIR